MTFAEVLPHLAAGKRVRRKVWSEANFISWQSNQSPEAELLGWRRADLLATDWTLIEEPAREPDVCSETCGKWREESRATIARLTRVLDEREAGETAARSNWARDFVEGGKRESELRATIARLTRELAEAKRTTYSHHWPCTCFHCERLRQMSNQGR